MAFSATVVLSSCGTPVLPESTIMQVTLADRMSLSRCPALLLMITATRRANDVAGRAKSSRARPVVGGRLSGASAVHVVDEVAGAGCRSLGRFGCQRRHGAGRPRHLEKGVIPSLAFGHFCPIEFRKLDRLKRARGPKHGVRRVAVCLRDKGGKRPPAAPCRAVLVSMRRSKRCRLCPTLVWSRLCSTRVGEQRRLAFDVGKFGQR